MRLENRLGGAVLTLVALKSKLLQQGPTHNEAVEGKIKRIRAHSLPIMVLSDRRLCDGGRKAGGRQ
jgi:hypothetical protein